MKKGLISKIFYFLALVCFIISLATKSSQFMFFGGIFLIIASIFYMFNKKNNK